MSQRPPIFFGAGGFRVVLVAACDPGTGTAATALDGVGFGESAGAAVAGRAAAFAGAVVDVEVGATELGVDESGAGTEVGIVATSDVGGTSVLRTACDVRTTTGSSVLVVEECGCQYIKRPAISPNTAPRG